MGLRSRVRQALAGLVLAAGLGTAGAAQQPAREPFYAYTAEGRDSAALWKRHAEDAELVKDYDALELSVINADEALLQRLVKSGDLEFYVRTKSKDPQLHPLHKYRRIEHDGTSAAKGTGDDWYWDRIHGDSFIKAGIRGDGIVIAVLDTGIANKDHVLIKDNLERWYDWVNGEKEPYDDTYSPRDPFSLSHGLACAGEIVRSLPKVRIHLHKIHRPPGGENHLEDVLEAYNQIYKDKQQDKRPYVLSQSYGLETLGEFQGLGWQEADAIFAEAEERLWKSSDEIYLTAAAGNDKALPRKNGRPPKYPAQSERVISAGAYDEENELSSFSSLGGTVYAPGSWVLLASPEKNNTMTVNNGTSFAGPLAAADVAGILSYCRTHGIPYQRTDIYAWVPEWTDRETSKVHYKLNGIDSVLLVEMRQIDFENTLAGLEALRKTLKK
jgi:hypothetical protein